MANPSFIEDTRVQLPIIDKGSVAWADYTGDGKPDFLLTGETYNSSTYPFFYNLSKLYKNTGSGFVEDVSINLPIVEDSSVAWADYNGDNKPDFLLTGRNYTHQSNFNNVISKLYRNTGSGFTEDITVKLTGVAYSSVAWADYNSDGKPDFLLTGSNSGSSISKLYKNTGSGFIDSDTKVVIMFKRLLVLHYSHV